LELFFILFTGKQQTPILLLNIGEIDMVSAPDKSRVETYTPPVMVLYRDGTDEILFDTPNRQVIVNGQPRTLTPTEQLYMKILVEHVGKAVSHEEMAEPCLGHSYSPEDTHTNRVNIDRMRKKLAPHGKNILLTVHGIGYKLELTLG
jgi:hypothetical protein